jgi:hypothetical protein
MIAESLLMHCRPAFTGDIQGWSWGTVERPRSASSRWQDRKGTLDDESIFGVRENYRCFCGKCSGEAMVGLFCPICWALIESNQSRKTRLGKIDLKSPISHPFEQFPSDLWVIPVLPAAIREEYPELDPLYDNILASPEAPQLARRLFDEIIGCVKPVFLNIEDVTDPAKVTLGRGMAITPRRAGREILVKTPIVCAKCGGTYDTRRLFEERGPN